MCALGFFKDAMGNMANNREMLKSRQELLHAYTKAEHYKGAPGKSEMTAKKVRSVNHKALKVVKDRVGKTRLFEKWAFAIMALLVVILVVWLFWG